MNIKQELLELLNQIILYFEVQAQYGGIEKYIYDYYKSIQGKCDKFNFQDIRIHNWSRAYLEVNSDWNNPILETMNKADELVKYFQVTIVQSEVTSNQGSS